MGLPRLTTTLRATPDIALWVVLALPVALEHLLLASGGGPAEPSPVWLFLVALVVIGVAVATRTSRPTVSLAVATGLTVVVLLEQLVTGSGFPVSYIGVLAVLSWLAGRHSERARGLVVVVAGADVGLLVLGAPLRGDVPAQTAVLNWAFIVLYSLLVVVLPWLLGRYRGQQAMLASAGWERAERTEAAQRLVVEQTRLRERTRIAEDMHDSLGHQLSLIALRAGALELDPDLLQRHRTAAGELRASAATATERLGQIVGVLREEHSDAALRPAAEGMAALVERAADSGLDVRLDDEGSATQPPEMVERAAHRVTQEALTNAARHAPGAPVTVHVRRAADQTVITIRNGAPTRPLPDTVTGGRGLIGLAERVRAVGGTFEAGPVDGGFAVTARLGHQGPLPAGAPTTDAPTTGSVHPDATPALPGSAAELAVARSRSRRGLATAVGASLGLGVLLGSLMLVYYVVVGSLSVLGADDYASLRVGQPRAEVADVLPAIEMVSPPTERQPSTPPNAECEFYRSAGAFSGTFAYRLCFADGRLVAKDVVQQGSTPVREESSR